MKKLWAYIVENNPDVLLGLEEDFSVTRYLEKKVDEILPLAAQLQAEGNPLYKIEEICLNKMTADLRPSRFLYIRKLIEEEFRQDYDKLRENGMLTYTVMLILKPCISVFEAFDFSAETAENNKLRYAVIREIRNYLP